MPAAPTWKLWSAVKRKSLPAPLTAALTTAASLTAPSSATLPCAVTLSVRATMLPVWLMSPPVVFSVTVPDAALVVMPAMLRLPVPA